MDIRNWPTHFLDLFYFDFIYLFELMDDVRAAVLGTFAQVYHKLPRANRVAVLPRLLFCYSHIYLMVASLIFLKNHNR